MYIAYCNNHVFKLQFAMYSLNILLDSNGRGRIGDFGFSWELPDVEGSRSVFTSEGLLFQRVTLPMSSPMEDVARNRMSTAMGL